MFLFKNKSAFSLLELLVASCIILILIGTFAIYLNLTLKSAREEMLRYELMNIRMAVGHYQMINKKFPEDLSRLLKKDLTFKGNDNKIISAVYLKSSRLDKWGNLLDPFMKRYIYNNINGTVYSPTKGYERW